MRDGALTMRAWLEHSGEPASEISTLMDAYAQWVLRAQDQADPHGIDIRAEPKFFLPNANVFTGGWCRPQQDGPGLRSTTLMIWAKDLIANGDKAYVTKYLWTGDSSNYNGGAIKYDLDYVVTAWESNGCDPWENVENTAIFWVRYNSYRSLVEGAEFATMMGDSASAATYSQAAASCLASLPSFWNGQFIYEMTNRELDSAVVSALNTAYLGKSGEENFAPTAPWVIATAGTLNEYFYDAFPINQKDDAAGVPGILWGRFKGDDYGSGVWTLCTAAYAQLLYRAADSIVVDNALPEDASLFHFAKIFESSVEELRALSVAEFALQVAQTGDGVLDRLRYHVEPYAYHLNEQLNIDTGAPASVENLSWSYANVLRAMAARDSFALHYQQRL